MSPIVQDINEFLELHGIDRQTFACEVLEYLPESKKFLQRTGFERRCTRAHKVQIWRHLAGNHTPRKEMLTAFQNWKRNKELELQK